MLTLIPLSMLALNACVTTNDQLGKKDDSAAAVANMQLAINSMQQGDLSGAKEKIDKALGQDPKNAAAKFVAGMLYSKINEVHKANEYYADAVALEPRNGDYVNGYAAFLCAHKNFAKGEKMALKVADDPLYKVPYVALLNAGNCAIDDGRANKAEEYFRRALKLEPNFTPALFQMAELEFKGANYLSARAFLERYQQNAPASAASLWLGVRIERGMGNMSAAQNYARRLKEEFSTSDETKALLDLERK
jgi:type IV pilus assembly protein PilF